MSQTAKKSTMRDRRKKRIRGKISGTAEKPRLSVFRSAKHVYAQVIDDVEGVTLVGISSQSKDSKTRANKEFCTSLGKKIAEKCLAKKIQSVVFDRNGYIYHGRVQAVAEGAREAGLKF